MTIRRPVLSYLALSYAISWAVWFAIPLVSGGEWSLTKVLVGVGLGPGLAAVLLDRLRGNAGAIDGRWWRHFAAVFAIVTALGLWSLAAPDARSAAELAGVRAAGLTPAGVAASLLAAAVCGFIFASCATSRTPTLSSITRWRVPVRWWLIAAFFPAALLLISLAVAYVTNDEIPPLVRPLGYVVRALLFTFFVVGLGEEPGWRGWMLPELLKRFNPFVSSVLLGVAWGLWHLPLYIVGLYPGPADAVLEQVFVGPLISIFFTWIYLRTGGNLLLAVVLHTAINNSARLLPTTMLFPILLAALLVGLLFTERMFRRRV